MESINAPWDRTNKCSPLVVSSVPRSATLSEKYSHVREVLTALISCLLFKNGPKHIGVYSNTLVLKVNNCFCITSVRVKYKVVKGVIGSVYFVFVSK